MSEFKPGDVAMVRLDSETEVRVTRLWGDWVSAKGTRYDPALAVRPLVVIDPDQIPVAKGGLAPTWLRNLAADLRQDDRTVSTSLENVLLFLADEIERQLAPPRIDEPGLWGVVEATVPGIPRRRWVHHEEERWVSDEGVVRHWEALVDPTLVREGVPND